MFRSIKQYCPLLLVLLGSAVRAEMVGNEDLIDPTRPLTGAVQSSMSLTTNELPRTGRLRVDSILIRGDSKLAVINAQRVEEGDRIGEATVLSIVAGLVQVEINGEKRDLPLYQSSIKTIVESER